MNAIRKRRPSPLLVALSVAAVATLAPAAAYAVDAEAAQGLARQNGCFKCHSVDKKKVGPAWKDVAAKLKGNKDAEEILTKWLTTGPKMPSEPGETHVIVKSRSAADTKNLVDWILSL
jgi:cytochrome c